MSVLTNKRIGSLGTIKVAGIKMGVRCARQILEWPELSGLAIKAFFLSKARTVIDEFRRTGDLDDDGEAAFRDGFDRGIELQMQNPAARIEIRGI